jgi:hypothetical protein
MQGLERSKYPTRAWNRHSLRIGRVTSLFGSMPQVSEDMERNEHPMRAEGSTGT